MKYLNNKPELIAFLIAAVIFAISFGVVAWANSQIKFTRGEYSKCYKRGEEHWNVKVKYQYSTLEKCERDRMGI